MSSSLIKKWHWILEKKMIGRGVSRGCLAYSSKNDIECWKKNDWQGCVQKMSSLLNNSEAFFWLDQTFKVVTRDPTRDGWIKEFIKQKCSGLLWEVRAAEEKKIPTAISKQLFQVVFSIFCGQNKFFVMF